MKILYINDRRVDITPDIYFPFTITPEDLENPTSIGVATTKTVYLPFTATNDDLFGYICNWNRKTNGFSDFGVGINFNQTKKSKYKLMVDSEIISQGYVTISKITTQGYEVTFYDALIEYFDKLQAKKLNELEIYESSSPWSVRAYRNSLNITTPIKSCYNIREQKLGKSKLRCTEKVPNGGGYDYSLTNVDLPVESTELQLQCVKSYNTDFAIPINKVIESINTDIEDIVVVDSALTSIFNEIHIIANPLTDATSEYHSTLGADITGTKTNIDSSAATYQFTMVNASSNKLLIENEKVYMELDVQYKITNPAGDFYLTRFWSDDSTYVDYGYSTADGTKIGEHYLKISLGNYQGDLIPTLLGETKDIYYRVDLLKGINCVFYGATMYQPDYALVTVKIPVLFNNYPRLDLTTSLPHTNVKVEIYSKDANFNSEGKRTEFFGSSSTDFYWDYDFMKLKSTTVIDTTKYDEPHSGILINGASLYPKVTARDFILYVVKYLNLGLAVIDDKITIFKKPYYVSNDIITIDEVEDVDVALITFDKMKYNTGIPDNDYLTQYNKSTGTIYGEQLITTGYSIKENIKEVTFDVSIPSYMTDANGFAYDRYNRYYNGGYNFWNHGVTQGFNDVIALGFINTITQDLYIGDDSYYEANYKTFTSESEEFVMKFEAMVHSTEDDTWLYNGNFNNETKLTSYRTFSPYRFNGNVIDFSLEMNKPQYTAARITDTNYPNTVTIYQRCHRKAITDKYSPDTHIVKCKLYINGWVDIYKIYNYKNNNYIIQSIVEYDATQPGMYQVELLRVNDTTNYINAVNLT